MKEKIIEIVGFNMEPERAELIAQRVLDLFAVSGSLPTVENRERIAYLKGITKYTIWADYVPNGDEECDKYQEELDFLVMKHNEHRYS